MHKEEEYSSTENRLFIPYINNDSRSLLQRLDAILVLCCPLMIGLSSETEETIPLLTYRSIILPKHGSINRLILKILTSSIPINGNIHVMPGRSMSFLLFAGRGAYSKKVFREARLRAEVQPRKPYFTTNILLSYAFYRQMTW